MGDENFTASYAYCSAATPSTVERITVFHYGVLAVDVLTIILASVLFFVNKYIMKRYVFVCVFVLRDTIEFFATVSMRSPSNP